jgi:oligopeptidase A
MQPNRSFTLARLPRFSEFDPTTLTARLEHLIKTQRARIAGIVSEPGAPDWDRIGAPLEAMAMELHATFGPASHLHNVCDSEALREPYRDAVERVSAFTSELAQDTRLCACYKALRASPGFANYDQARRKVVDNALRDFRLGGVDLPPEAQAEVRALRVELAQLASRFEENVLDATQTFRLAITDPARLAGLPPGVLALARQNAAAAGIDGWVLTLDFPCYMPAMTHLADRELRRALYEAYSTRASDQGPQAGRHDNSALIADILDRRQRLARLLGYANFAELALATRMAPSTAAVREFLTELAGAARPAAVREFARLQEFARDTLELERVEAWDVAWCSEQLRQREHGLSQEDLRPYFPVARVVAGLFEVVGALFDVHCERIDGVDTWHPDASFHAVRDASGEDLGYFYLDLFARPGKRPGAWMDDCLTRWRDQSGLQLPVAYLNCNFTPPLPERPSLLTHDEVLTLFHEFGHGLHHLLTEIDRPAVAGINGVPWDAVELPSQLLENWCWERAALDRIAAHHESGEPLPAALFDRLAGSRRFQAAMSMVRQLEFALFDFHIHTEYAPGTDVQAVLDAVRAEVAVITPPPWNRFQHSFSHIFAGGYAAGYYSYKWAEVLAADAYSRFEEEGVFNRATGRAFRASILARGGAEDAMTLFRAFRGREPSTEPLLRHAGLAA